MILERRAVEPFFKTGFVIGCQDTREGIVIDPGDEVDELLAAVAHDKLTIGNILLTHAHLDHVTGVAQAKRALGVPVWVATPFAADWRWLRNREDTPWRKTGKVNVFQCL